MSDFDKGDKKEKENIVVCCHRKFYEFADGKRLSEGHVEVEEEEIGEEEEVKEMVAEMVCRIIV